MKSKLVVDAERGTVGFDHDLLQATRGYEQGGLAAILVMDHSEGKEGPKELLLLKNNYRDSSKNSRWFCGALEHLH